ncbi:MAG: hypothetical protein AB7E36_08120 [Salinivirgaceae bacterium]
MKDWIRKDRLKFKYFSLERLNFFGLPTAFIVIGIIHGVFLFKADFKSINHLILVGFFAFLILGISTYYLQLNRLKFKNIRLTKNLDDFKTELKKILISNNWEIDYDNNLYLQATFRNGLTNLDMLTIKFKKKEIQWNVIRHPWSQNSIAALITINIEGRKMIEIIKAIA